MRTRKTVLRANAAEVKKKFCAALSKTTRRKNFSLRKRFQQTRVNRFRRAPPASDQSFPLG
jgi:hypothetical protein